MLLSKPIFDMVCDCFFFSATAEGQYELKGCPNFGAEESHVLQVLI